MTFVVPVRSFRAGKERLTDALRKDQRQLLGRRLADHVFRSISRAGQDLLIATADEEVMSWASARKIDVVRDPGTGLNAAANAGASWCGERGRRWCVLHSDLPFLTESDIASAAIFAGAGQDVIAPSADGGTSLLATNRTIEFRYGPGSFSRHFTQLADPHVITSLGLLHDIDSAADLESLTRLEPEWLVDS